VVKVKDALCNRASGGLAQNPEFRTHAELQLHLVNAEAEVKETEEKK